MPPRFQAKELIVLAPVLVLGLGVFLWSRAKTQRGFFERKMYVESVELRTAPGSKRAAGYSHVLVVKVNRSWPPPAYWDRCCGATEFYDASDSLPPSDYPYLGPKYQGHAAIVGLVVWKHNGKTGVLSQKQTPLGYGDLRKQDGALVFTHNLDLSAKTLGELDFYGEYNIAGQPPFKIHRVLRKEGGHLVFATDHDTGGKLTSLTHSPWETQMTPTLPIPTSSSSAPTKMGKEYNIDVFVRFRFAAPAAGSTLQPSVLIDNCELVDGAGRVFPVGSGGFNLGGSLPTTKNLPPGEYLCDEVVMLGPTFKGTDPLTLRGHLTLSDHWPMPFSIKLGPRP